MLISLNWIQQYLPTIDQVDADEVADRLSSSIAEVERVIRLGEGVNNIVVGEIISVEPHPKDEKLQVCQVKVEPGNTANNTSGVKQIIHGGGVKVKPGDKVPVCLPGGSILNPSAEFGDQPSIHIIEKDIKGVGSQGVLCSIKELGLVDEHKQVMILHPNSKVGDKLDYILKDTILEIENKALNHRPDCFSHLGIAREIAALYKLTVNEQPQLTKSALSSEVLELKVENKAGEVCPRFTAIVIRNIKIQPSPFWMQALLAMTGMRPINNIIDTSNYLMFDIGQPSHVFDYDKLNGKKIIVKKSKEGEKFTTLDGVERKTSKDMAVLTDGKRIIGVPGIMGAKEPEVSDSTKNIALVVENWEMYSIRRASRALGLRTEASTRFEKGLDPTKLTDILLRGADMLTDLSGGEIASEVIDIYPKPEKRELTAFDLNSIYRVLGIELTKDEIVNILEGLSIKVIGDEKIEQNFLNQADQSNKILLEIPSFRRDLKQKEDIIEEIARIYGYNKLTPTYPERDITIVEQNPLTVVLKRMRDLLSGYGIDEIYTYSMIGKNLASKAGTDIEKCIKIKNPLSPELSHVRNSLIPSLLEKAELNSRNRFNDFALYEISRIVYKDKKDEGKLPEQPLHLAITYYSSGRAASGNSTFEVVKGYLDALIKDFNLSDLTIEKIKKNKDSVFGLANTFNPEQSAKIIFKGKEIGVIGNIHPFIASNFSLKGNLSMLELEIDKELLKDLRSYSPMYKSIPSFPAVYRDISFWVSKSTEYVKIISKLMQAKVNHLEKIDLVDVFTEKSKEKEKSITLNLILRDNNGTLNDKQINESVSKITTILEKEFKARMRKS